MMQDTKKKLHLTPTSYFNHCCFPQNTNLDSGHKDIMNYNQQYIAILHIYWRF